MPNWCFNQLTVTGTKEELIHFIENGLYGYEAVYALNEFEKKFSQDQTRGTKLVPTMNKIIPVPQDVLDRGYSDAGYDWQIENWGTKWDFCEFTAHNLEHDLKQAEPNSILSLFFNFDTAWSTNEKWVLKASELFPKLIFDLSYEEEAGFFAGCVTYRANTELVRRDYTDMVVYRIMECTDGLEEAVSDRYYCYYDEETLEDILEQILDDFETALSLGLTTKEKVIELATAIYNENNKEEEVA